MNFHDLNSRAAKLCAAVVESADELDVRVRADADVTILDFAADRIGTWASATALSRICMSGLCELAVVPPSGELPLPSLLVTTDYPLESCIASQYAGFPFSSGDYYAMCSGPGRLVRGREPILEKYGLAEQSFDRVLVLEADRVPDRAEAQELVAELPGDGHTWVCVARTNSLPGTMQVVARSVETCLHKLFELGFDLRRVRRAMGSAPIPPLGKNSFQSLAWTNDAILYGADVQLWVEPAQTSHDAPELPIAQSGNASSKIDMTHQVDLDDLLAKLPSCSSSEFGQPFREIFERYDRDFYKVDRLLFSPARIVVHEIQSGRAMEVGALRHDLLRQWLIADVDKP